MLRLPLPLLDASRVSPRRPAVSAAARQPRAAASDTTSVSRACSLVAHPHTPQKPVCVLLESGVEHTRNTSHTRQLRSMAPRGARLQIVGGGSLGVPPGAVVRPESAPQPRRKGPLKSSMVAALIGGILALLGFLSLAFAIQSSLANLTHALGPAARSVASDSLQTSSIGLGALVVPGLKYGLEALFRLFGWS
jgi:hypothetical protein